MDDKANLYAKEKSPALAGDFSLPDIA